MTLLAVIPGEDEGDEKSDQENNVDSPLECGGDAPRFGHYLHALEHDEGTRQVSEATLNDFALFQPLKKRKVRHLRLLTRQHDMRHLRHYEVPTLDFRTKDFQQIEICPQFCPPVFKCFQRPRKAVYKESTTGIA